ncbi:hypothetical protein AAF712_011574 [Marasmius tenuissimus]|uniref:Uncharacterized protein n=1 Tax=Marasmius tenuissimus TaxID=585030 RepID=A0ABR2ZIW9_9AGAR
MNASAGTPEWGPTASELEETWVEMQGEFLDVKEGYTFDVHNDCDSLDAEEEEDGDYFDEADFNTLDAFDTVESRELDSDKELGL